MLRLSIDISILIEMMLKFQYRFSLLSISTFPCRNIPIFQESELLNALENNTANLSPDDVLDYDDLAIPHFHIGDKAFRMRTWFMKPYSMANVTHDERIFNYRLSRARRTVECSFGILVSRLVAIK